MTEKNSLTVPGNRVLILGAICLSLVAAIGAYTIGEKRRESLQSQTQRQSAVYIDLQNASEGGDLLEATLQKLNNESLLGTASSTSPFAPSVDDTLTDRLAKEVFINYAGQEAGTETRSEEEVINSIISQIDTSTLPQAVFSLTNVKMAVPRTTEDVRAYGNAIGEIIKANYLVIANKKQTIQLAEIGEIHKKMGNEIIKVTVPTTITQQHLALANAYVILGESFIIIAQDEKKDPLKSLLAIRTAKTAAENLDANNKEINSYFYKNGILFTNDEAGIVWSRIVSE